MRCIQERSYWCLPACLEFILSNKGFEISQQDIADSLKIDETGFNFDKELLNKFLEHYDLRCRHESPFLTGVESDLILPQLADNKDILVAYNSAKLKYKKSKKETKHVSIVQKYEEKTALAHLLDPAEGKIVIANLADLNNAIQAKENRRYGFYVISPAF